MHQITRILAIGITTASTFASVASAEAASECLQIVGALPAQVGVGVEITLQAQCCSAVPALSKQGPLLALVLLAVALLVLSKRRALLNLTLLPLLLLCAWPQPAQSQGCPAPLQWVAQSAAETFSGTGDSFSFTPTSPGSFVVTLTSPQESSTKTIEVTYCTGPIDDGDDCTTDVCDPLTGQVTHPYAPPDTLCEPIDACHEEGTCDGEGRCLPGGALAFDDGDACTVETCDPVEGLTRRDCPAVDLTVASIVADRNEWLHSGSDPLQTGVTAGTIERHRGTLVTGRVMSVLGLPLGGAVVTVHGHPELGQTTSQTNGEFTLVVNGGGQLTVQLSKDGFLASSRNVQALWGEETQVKDVVLLQPDTAVSEVDLQDASQPFQVVQGSVVTDEDGARQGVALVPAGTEATMTNEDGSVEQLEFMQVRITELTVGPSGPAAMPAELPPTSQYTYAFEINADEAVAVNAKSITFSQPLSYYVHNFLDFPSGTTVPVGSYDREKAVWVPEKNGIVLQVVSIAGGLADLSIDADAAAESPAELAALGITAEERAKLATLSVPGASLWRVPISHFTTPYDLNWNAFPPSDASGPPPPPPPPPDVTDDCEVSGASTIECQNQVLREKVPIAGTPFELNYASNRIPGWTIGRTLEVQVTGSAVPASLQAVSFQLEVAGRTLRPAVSTAPDQKFEYVWDGTDQFGREVNGGTDAKVSIGFHYDVVYAQTSSFGARGSGVAVTGDRARGDVTFKREYTRQLKYNWDQRRQGLGAWSLSAHHAYDPRTQTVYRGDGTRQAALNIGLVGYADRFSQICLGCGPDAIAAATDGSYFVASGELSRPPQGFTDSRYRHVVAKIAPSGVVTVIAGIVDGVPGYSGDGNLATQARLNNPSDLELAPDGSLYIADTDNHAIRKVTPNGIITTVAGTGTAAFSGDGGPATAARLASPRGIGLGSDGALFIADEDNRRVRRVATDGIIATVAGNGTSPGGALPQENVPAMGPGDILHPYDVAVEANGNLLITSRSHRVVRRLNQSNRVTTVAGIACGGGGCAPPDYVDGVPATQIHTNSLRSIVALPNGSFYFSDASVVRYVDANLIVRVVAGREGSGLGPLDANGVPARQLAFTLFDSRGSFARRPDGGLAIADGYAGRVITLLPTALPPVGGSELTVASTDGSEVYQFDAQGKHQTTRDALTGALRYQFQYDAHGRLGSVTDAYANVTTIERAGDGRPLAIVGPYGQRTDLSLDPNGYLESITSPVGQTVQMTYDDSGRMTAYQNARGQASAITYDSRGRLLSDRDAAGGTKTLTPTPLADGWRIDYTSSDEGSKIFELKELANARQQRSTTFPDGTTAVQLRAPDATRTTTHSDGTLITETHNADPRFGIEVPIVSRSTRLPSGLTYTESALRTTTLNNPADPLSLSTLIDERTVNGRLWRQSYDAPTRTWTLTTPTGRRTFRRLNDKGDLVEDRTETLLAQVLAYDTQGRLSTLTQGTRQSLMGYSTSGPAAGYLETARNPLLQTTTFSRDAVGRALSQLDPASNLTQFSWDPDGNLASVTPPGRPEHDMSYTPVNLMSEYAPPLLASIPDGRTVYEYNLARNLERATRPDGLVIEYDYDAAGRLTDTTTPDGVYERDYYGLIPCAGCAAGKVSRVTSPDGIALDYTYDGQLLTQATWSGAITGAVGFAYNTDFRVRTETVTSASGSAAWLFGFDNDQLLTCASPTNCASPGADALRLTYGGAGTSGLPTGNTLGTVTEALTYNTIGELATQVGKVGTTTVFSEDYNPAAMPRDALGRIRRKIETVGGTTSTWDYSYDLAGRLQTVSLNGASYESYTYDSNGNRLTVVKPGGTTTATYDDQDRLLTLGPWTYTYTPNGELLTKGNSGTGEDWGFEYDVFGNLKRVELPNSDVIEYLVDGRNRRVGKKKNGVLVKQWLYKDQLRPVAELDGAGNLLARFVFASGKNSPDLVMRGGVTYRVFTDQLGSPRALVNAGTGAVAGVLRHDAWGVVLDDSVSALMPFGFAGGLYDPETGLTRFGARDYDPSVGRWVSKDPILFGGAQANIYMYVGNDPVNFVDPRGEAAAGAAAAAFPLGPAIGIGVGLYCLFNSAECANFFKKLADDVVDACRPKDFAPPRTPRPDPKCASWAQDTYNHCIDVMKMPSDRCSIAADEAYRRCIAGNIP